MTPPQFLARDDGERIAYRRLPGKEPGIVFLGGFMSDMTGTKATALEAFCKARGQAFLRFDYFGHGASTGAFRDGTIGRWRDDALAVIDRLTEGKLILVGSSMGGWIMLLAALARPERVAALVGIAPAPDFTEDLLWPSFSPEEQRRLLAEGAITIASQYDPRGYIVSRRLIEEGRNHLLLSRTIDIACPVRLLHGMKDEDVPWKTSLRLAERLVSEDVRVTLVKNGDHRLSTGADLALLQRTLEELL
ncbi:MAG: alpha/beta hydrolase [Rhodospirillales bacterium]|nr:alpha/beta hydrolase [Rhodospirillales bacterium]